MSSSSRVALLSSSPSPSRISAIDRTTPKRRALSSTRTRAKKTNENDMENMKPTRTSSPSSSSSFVSVDTKPAQHSLAAYTPAASVVGGIFLATALVTKYINTGEPILVSSLNRHPNTFLFGLLLTSVALELVGLSHLIPDAGFASVKNKLRLVIAGFCVGFGSACAGGCTSGHELSGIARLSKRSLVATLIFLISAMFTASVFDSAGALNVVARNATNTFTMDIFLKKLFINIDMFVPWISQHFYYILVPMFIAGAFVALSLFYKTFWTETASTSFNELSSIDELELFEATSKQSYKDNIKRGSVISTLLFCAILFASAFLMIAAAEAESKFHTSKLLIIWLSSCLFFALVTLSSFVVKNQNVRSGIKLVSNFVSGALFGVALTIGKMTDPAKVAAFLTVANRDTWDPSLLVFLATALFCSIPIFAYIKHRLKMKKSTFGDDLAEPTTPNRLLDGRLLVGSIVFGVGWGLAGLCPGPAYVNLGIGFLGLRFDAPIFLFFTAFFVGQTFFRDFIARVFNLDNKIKAIVTFRDKKEIFCRLNKTKSLSKLEAQIKQVLSFPETYQIYLAYSEGDWSAMALSNDDDVETMFAQWEAEKTGKDSNLRLKFLVVDSLDATIKAFSWVRDN